MLTTPTASDPVNLNFMNTSVLYCQRRLLYRQLSNSKGSLQSKSVVTDSAEQSSETIMFGNVQLLTPRLIIVCTLYPYVFSCKQHCNVKTMMSRGVKTWTLPNMIVSLICSAQSGRSSEPQGSPLQLEAGTAVAYT